MNPKETIAAFDQFLVARALHLDAVVIGGTALALMGVITRETRDCDVLHPAIPIAVREAARLFAAESSLRGIPLDQKWLNEGPASLTRVLPEGWQERTLVVFRGEALVLRTLGREELLMSKVFALCDRGTDLGDCIALAPTSQELDQIKPWLAIQDAHLGWPSHVVDTLADLRRRLGHGI